MRLLVLWQPWATLIAAGVKTWETRPQPTPATVTGKRVAIGAAATDQGWKVVGQPLMELLEMRFGVFSPARREILFPRRVITCTTVLSSCLPTETALERGLIPYSERLCGDYSPTRFATLLTGLCVPPPGVAVDVVGSQGWPRLPVDVFERLQVAGMADGATGEE